MTPFPKADPACDHCAGNGFVFRELGVGAFDDDPQFDNCVAVERCDECLYHGFGNARTIYDVVVARHVYAQGLDCRRKFPCVLKCPTCHKPYRSGCCGHEFDATSHTFKHRT